MNGLVAATLLAKAGRKTLVLERAERVGGCAITSEIVPGFKGPTLSHWAAIDPGIVRGLALERHGLQIANGDALGCVPSIDGPALTIWRDRARTQQELAARSVLDSDRYPAFVASVGAVNGVLRKLTAAPAPSIDAPTAADLVELLTTGRRFRGLSRKDAYSLLRWLPMPVADFADEWFEQAAMRVAVAAGGVFGSHLGPRSAGSTAIFLLMSARHDEPLAAGWTARGGIGALSDAAASAARQAGVEIRTGASVERVIVRDETAQGVVLDTGEEIQARAVVSSADPRRTLLDVRRPDAPCARLPSCGTPHPDARHALEGQLRRVRPAAVLEPVPQTAARRRSQDGSGWREMSTRSSARSTPPSTARLPTSRSSSSRFRLSSIRRSRRLVSTWCRLTSSSHRPNCAAPPGMSSASGSVIASRASSRPMLRDSSEPILGRQVITPADLEGRYGLTGGQIFHGELALDQLLLARPLLGWARYATPIRNLYICGSGTHPGTGLDGRSGALAAREILKTARARNSV